MGLPYLHGLRRRYGPTLAVWPQETGFANDPFAARPGTSVVLAEIWPTALAPAYAGGVRDEEQVRGVVQRCSQRLRAGNRGECMVQPCFGPGPGTVYRRLPGKRRRLDPWCPLEPRRATLASTASLI